MKKQDKFALSQQFYRPFHSKPQKDGQRHEFPKGGKERSR
jgi:hypothetical protein